MVELTDMINGERVNILLAKNKNGKFGIYMVSDNPHRVKLIAIDLETLYEKILSEYINKDE
jgi:hypothetical protein